MTRPYSFAWLVPVVLAASTIVVAGPAGAEAQPRVRARAAAAWRVPPCRARAVGPAVRVFRSNPPGPRGGPGTNWANPPGPAGGPGASPFRLRPYRGDRDDNPPGRRGGPGTDWENPPGPRGGPGASPNRRPWPRRR
ncbi:MAG: hypothetical protein AB7O28_00840 [Vicinamibacterales bacterium]